MADAWNKTPTKWYPLPIGVGALLLAAIQYRKEHRRKAIGPEVVLDEKTERAKLKGPWQVWLVMRSLYCKWYS